MFSEAYRVWFIRYGVRHYYPAESLGEAKRFVRVWKAIGGQDVTVQTIETPDGIQIDVR